MKHVYYLVFIIVFSQLCFSQNNTNTPSSSCANSNPACAVGGFSFQNVSATQAETASQIDPLVQYSCLGSQPNPNWFYIKIATSGVLDFQISQNTSQDGSGSPLDVDYILWGPFTSPTCGDALNGKIADNIATDQTGGLADACSYSVAAVESFSINGVAEQYYMLLVTNYSNQAGFITINQTNFTNSSLPPPTGVGTTDCSNVCLLSLGQSPTLCEGQTVNLYANLNGQTGTSFTWTSPNVANFTQQTTQSITVGTPGIYTVVVTRQGCATMSSSISVLAPTPLAINYSPPSVVACNGETFNLNSNTTSILNGLSATNYTVTYYNSLLDAKLATNPISNPNDYSGIDGETIYVGVSGSTGCINTTSFTLSLVTCTLLATNSGSVCANSTANLFASGLPSGYTYSWTGPNGFTSSLQNPTQIAVPTGTAPFVYSVTATRTGLITYAASTTLQVNPVVAPVFSPIASLCSGAFLAPIPTTSNNGITGTWSPALSNTITRTYTFSPTSGQCANSTTLQIIVNPKTTTTFNAVSPICSGSTLNPLPTTSTNSINGSWSPVLNNTQTTTYTFTPNEGECATTKTLTITVNPNVTPTFPSIAPICSGASLAALPTTSTNGISGTWNPVLNNSVTTTYTFTPTAGQCATITTLTITVNPNVTPTFAAIAPICSGASLAALPTTSTNGISGTWNPALNNLVTTNYTFVATTVQCATTTLTITVFPTITYYADADADGYGNAFVSKVSCTGTPIGYVSNSLDCNDANATIHPGAVEICGDGIDNDCNGVVDETCLTEIKPVYWNTTLASLDTSIVAIPFPGAQMYRFEVKSGATIIGTYEINSANPNNFALAKFLGVAYSTTYSIRVALKIGGTWGGYGNSHNVSTPVLSPATVLTTKILSTFCGTTLSSLDTKIGTTPVSAATGYRFEITTSGTTTVYDSATYNFRLADAVVATYGTTYAIRVAAQVNGVYGNYGVSCVVTTPSLTANNIPTTAILPAICGTTLATLTTKIGTMPVYAATAYRFEITTAGTTTIYNSPVYNFILSQAGVTVSYNTSYTIRVAAYVNGFWGNYGASCVVTTPPAPTRLKAKMFDVVAYPNPFNSAFKLQVTTLTDETIFVSVYDMMGKQVEHREVTASEIENSSLGQEYAKGIYNVLVAQGVNTKTVRLVKK